MLCNSEIVFGSAARMSCDHLSDYDYMIVDDDAMRLKSRKERLSKYGVSVTDFTWSRLVHLFNKKTMFAVHLAKEAKAVVDRNNRFFCLASSFVPATSYEEWYVDSLRLFNGLARIPNSSRGYLWALDLIAVAFRNSAILWLAERGEYYFSLQHVLHKMYCFDVITSFQLETLSKLRDYKFAFRNHRLIKVSRDEVYAVASAVDSCFRLGMQIGFVDGLCLTDDKVLQCKGDPYLAMRCVEAEAISASGIYGSSVSSQVRELSRLFKNPHDYCRTFCNQSEYTNRLLLTLRLKYF